MSKPKVAFYWCASCGGCEEAVVDLADDLLAVAAAVEIVLWPVALDFKRADVEALPDAAIDVAFINGAVRTSEQAEMVHLLRRKSRLVVAFGSCAHLGGIPGLANLSSRAQILATMFHEVPSVDNPDRIQPQPRFNTDLGVLELPSIDETVKALDQVIEVDYYLPGCAPPPALVKEAINAILSGTLPASKSVLAPVKALCDTCPRRSSKPDKIALKTIRRIALTDIPADRCFLAEGVICLGPATRTGCGERCINACMPCRGCFGPVGEVQDQGAKFLSALMSLFEATDAAEIRTIADSVIDPAGLFYMFSLPASLKTKFLE